MFVVLRLVCVKCETIVVVYLQQDELQEIPQEIDFVHSDYFLSCIKYV